MSNGFRAITSPSLPGRRVPIAPLRDGVPLTRQIHATLPQAGNSHGCAG